MLWKVITINKYLPAELKVGVLCLWLPKPGHLPAQWSSWPQLWATSASLFQNAGLDAFREENGRVSIFCALELLSFC